ncbi:Acid beta-fructofuranosidase [Thalictrum thalictroides]|uniref:Acid beta-fructofuranosidase n=1 Tax=Thalictrum thalictroides TaxID=46969 RepID=A0A7J6WN51_THATH|nr:Acid beta-fructofuranosidase [Thalictrum thalictroides]
MSDPCGKFIHFLDLLFSFLFGWVNGLLCYSVHDIDAAPMFYKGWYHFFYQYNPKRAVWGHMVWGHAVSRDLINWFYLPHALVNDQWYDIRGVWTGSLTFLQNGSIIVLYTGETQTRHLLQSLARPANLSDPLLIDWVKYSGNPIIYQPKGVPMNQQFRDPSSAWLTPDGTYKFTFGAKYKTTGISLIYETKDFTNYTLLNKWLHRVPHTGMWECVELYPVSVTDRNGLDISVRGPQVKHVLKVSIDEQQRDYYAIGSFNVTEDHWTPDDPAIDVGIELRYDYGKFYASRTFYDPIKKRRILWGYSRETDTVAADKNKGWANVENVPREIVFDNKTKTNVLQWPVEEVESLRTNKTEFNDVKLGAGSIVPLKVGNQASQLDITVDFEIDKNALEANKAGGRKGYNCTTSNGAAGRSVLGPFGLLVSANDNRSEQTAIYFYVTKGTDGNLKTFFCTDQSRHDSFQFFDKSLPSIFLSSKSTDVNKEIYGCTIPVLDNEKLSLRVLVDHSIVEAFAQGGRRVITSRIYPTEAIEGAERVFLFNNATDTSVTATSIKIWQMKSASMKFYFDDQKKAD